VPSRILPSRILPSRILIVEYDPRWPDLFAREAARIRSALGSRAQRIEHAGSTSVPGLAAKPVVDVVLVVADSADEDAYAPALKAAGYVLSIREPHWYEHRMFRDWLRGNAVDRDLYARTKLALAQKEWENVQNYADAKTVIIDEIIARARSRNGASFAKIPTGGKP
jgi:GrpB-like predicted nucleotidyltransferase (UPF0157 family)